MCVFFNIAFLGRARAGLVPFILVWAIALFNVGSSKVEAQSPAHDTIREEDRMGARSDEYSRVFDRAISALVKADAAAFRALLSSATVLSETRGPGAIDVVIQDKFIPFFSDFDELSEAIATMPTFDSRGNSGIAIARSFITKGGAKKSFVIYIVAEKEKPVVGNLLLNATEEILLKNKGKTPLK